MVDPAADQLQHLPANLEDRKAAIALSSINDDLGSRVSSAADQEELGKAMSRLEITAGQGGITGGKVAKVRAEDVNLLVCAFVRALSALSMGIWGSG